MFGIARTTATEVSTNFSMALVVIPAATEITIDPDFRFDEISMRVSRIRLGFTASSTMSAPSTAKALADFSSVRFVALT